MTRAAVSVPSNIAEGHERGSTKEFTRFLYIAKGSTAELRTQLEIAQRVGELDQKAAVRFLDEAKQINAMLQALITSTASTVGEKRAHYEVVGRSH